MLENNRKKNVCIIANGYPTKQDPMYAFIQPIARGLADRGYSCTVIAPQSITNRIINGKQKRPYRWIDKTDKGSEVTIIQPQYFSVSNLKVKGQSVSIKLRDDAIVKCYEKEDVQADVIYAHFWDCGIVACKISENKNIPVFVATGESKIRVYNYYTSEIIAKYKKIINGIICVSTKNLNESIDRNLIDEKHKTVVLPNGYDSSEFYPMDKKKARKELGFPSDDMIAVFVGEFSHRKGVLRVVQSARKIPNLKLILIGSGDLDYQSNQIIYSGTVPHDMIVKYLNSSDVFVLPTLAEGCCNAIIEALACGLPIISSDLPFNKDVLNSKNSIMIDPENLNELSMAMEKIVKNDMLRKNMSEASLSAAKELLIENRIYKISEFMGLTV